MPKINDLGWIVQRVEKQFKPVGDEGKYGLKPTERDRTRS